jgi:hypothetical protein
VIRDTLMELRRLLMGGLLVGGLVGAYSGTVGGLSVMVGPSPLLASGVVMDTDVEEEVGPVISAALFRVHPECAAQRGPAACPVRLVERYGRETVHLRGDDGQQVTVAALPSPHPSFPDEDPRDDYLLVVVRSGDRVSAVLRSEQAELTRQSPEDVRLEPRRSGLGWMALGQLGGLLCVGLWALLRWLGVQPPPRPEGWYERPLIVSWTLPFELTRGPLMLITWPMMALLALSVPVGVLMLLFPLGTGTAGVVTDPGDEQGVIAMALWNMQDRAAPVESARAPRLHLRQSDGQIVEVEADLPSAGFPDEDPRPEYYLHRVRSGDPVIASRSSLERGTREDQMARRRQAGLRLLLMGPLMMLFVAGHSALIWNYRRPWSSSSSMISSSSRTGSRG